MEAKEGTARIFKEAVREAQRNYNEAIKPLWVKRRKQENVAWGAYQQARDNVGRAYIDAKAPMEKEYRQAIISAKKVYEKAQRWDIKEGNEG